MTMTTLPAAPSRGDPATFADKGDALMAALPGFVTEANALETNVVAKESAATASASAAATSETNAAASAAEAAATTGVIAWVSGTTYAVGDNRFSPIDFQTYRRTTAGAGTTDPVSDTTNWEPITGTRVVRVARTSDTILGVTNRGNLIEVTSGTFSQTFTAAATLASGWFCWYFNSGTGVVTLDPNGAETINGAATKRVDPGCAFLIQCSGSAFTAIQIGGVGNHAVEVHTGNGAGSTNTKNRIFTTTVLNVGTAITYATSAANGASFTANEPGLYYIEWADVYGTAGFMGISLNSASLTTAVQSLAYAERVALSAHANAAVSRVTALVRLVAGDVIRPHAGTTVPSDTSDVCRFIIRKVAV